MPFSINIRMSAPLQDKKIEDGRRPLNTIVFQVFYRLRLSSIFYKQIDVLSLTSKN